MGKITHLVLKMGKENYMFDLTVGTVRAAWWLNFAWEKREKNLWEEGRNQANSGEANYIFWSENESPINCVHEKRSFINT